MKILKVVDVQGLDFKMVKRTSEYEPVYNAMDLLDVGQGLHFTQNEMLPKLKASVYGYAKDAGYGVSIRTLQDGSVAIIRK